MSLTDMGSLDVTDPQDLEQRRSAARKTAVKLLLVAAAVYATFLISYVIGKGA